METSTTTPSSLGGGGSGGGGGVSSPSGGGGGETTSLQRGGVNSSTAAGGSPVSRRGGGNNNKKKSSTRFFLFVSAALVVTVSIVISFKSTKSLSGLYYYDPTSYFYSRDEEQQHSSNHVLDPSSSSSSSAFVLDYVRQQLLEKGDNSSSGPAAAARAERKAEEVTENLKGQTWNGRRSPNTDRKDMNIVLFYADDWTWRTIGAVNRHVKTPNIDAMAKNGVMFTHNCVTTSICWQSRATLVTGLYTSVHRQMKISDDSIFNKTVNWTSTLYPLLKQNDYKVGYVGKWHAPMQPEYKEEGFDSFKNYYGKHWMRGNGPNGTVHVTEANGNDALAYLQRIKEERLKRQQVTDGGNDGEAGKEEKKDMKFALTVSFFATHSWDGKKFPDQFQPQPYSEAMYPANLTTIPVPLTAAEEYFLRLPKFLQGGEARHRWKERYNTPDRYQETMRRIYRMATEVDDVVGKVIQELKDQGVCMPIRRVVDFACSEMPALRKLGDSIAVD